MADLALGPCGRPLEGGGLQPVCVGPGRHHQVVGHGRAGASGGERNAVNLALDCMQKQFKYIRGFRHLVALVQSGDRSLPVFAGAVPGEGVRQGARAASHDPKSTSTTVVMHPATRTIGLSAGIMSSGFLAQCGPCKTEHSKACQQTEKPSCQLQIHPYS